jgi:prepilin-type N-terminal cleavage/methylation domain-containing protein
MKTRRRSRRLHRQFWKRGFTLIEMVVIIAVVGILAAIAAPSFTSMMDSMKVDQSVVSLRTSLQENQRQAIRTSQVCTMQVPRGNGKGNNGNGNGNNGNGNGKKKSITSNCQTSESSEFPESINLASNLKTAVTPTSPSSETTPSSETIEVKFGPLGGAEFLISSAVQPPAIPLDPSGKVVAFIANKPQVKMKCVAISSTLGLTRIGTYTGSTVPAEITDKGVCTALDWKQQ